MKKRFLLLLASASCLMLPTCLSIDSNGLLNLGADAVCGVLTSGLPWSGELDYCSVVDIDLGGD
jgi:hypothetical protein